MTNSSLQVSVLQMNSSAEIEDNLNFIETALANSEHSHSTDLLVLPENFACMATDTQQYIAMAETYGDGDIQLRLSELAKKYSTWLVAGSLPIVSSKVKDKVYSSCIVINPQGEYVLRYDKIHLFDVVVEISHDGRKGNQQCYQESGTFLHGDIDQKNFFETPWGKVAVSICYDIRFPEMYRKVPESVFLHCIPAAFTYETGKAHWQTLLTARAIENQCFIAAAAQTGAHDNQRQTWGHSMVVHPWGATLSKLETRIGLSAVSLDMKELIKIRQNFPCLSHKRAYINTHKH